MPKVTLPRGYKSWAENTAMAYRSRLGITDSAPLSPSILAEYLGVKVWSLGEIPGLGRDSLSYLTSTAASEWSGVTVQYNNTVVVVTNPQHTSPRRNSDLMHELAHVIRAHEPARVYIYFEAAISLRTFDHLQEEEATWLSGALLLPRTALLSIGKQELSRIQACELYGVSEELFKYRMNVTGVSKLYAVA